MQVVLDYLESKGEPSTLSLKALTLRTVFLLAVARPSRPADLCISRMRTQVEGVLAVLAKQSPQGKKIEEFFSPHSQVTQACARWTPIWKKLRGDEKKLFISLIKAQVP